MVTAYEPLLTALSVKLLHHRLMLVTAESCTGGLLANILTSLPGSSAWFDQGFVTYSESSKTKQLGVSSSLIADYSAVSEPVVKSMAEGALKRSCAQISVAITGHAGPDGGNATSPVGTVWVAFAIRTKLLIAECLYFPQKTREEVRYLTCLFVLKKLNELL